MKGKLRCAKWCGRGCTEAEYQRAYGVARRVAKKLGKGWRVRVFENLGWHAEVVSACNRINVSISRSVIRGGNGYTAFIHDAGNGPGGDFAYSSGNVREAVKGVVVRAKAEARRYAEMVAGL